MQLSVIINNVGIKISVSMNVKKLYYKGRCERRFIWNPPSKHFLVLKTSSARLQRNNFTSSKTSWRHLKDVLEDEKLFSWRRLEDTSWKRLEGMSWRRLQDRSWRCFEDISWRHLEGTIERNKILTGDICI